MERVEQRRQIDRSAWGVLFDVPALEIDVGHVAACEIAPGLDDGGAAVIEAEEFDRRTPDRELACDLARTTSEIDDETGLGEMGLNEVGESPDRRVTRIAQRKRVVVVEAVELVVERLVTGRGPSAPRPVQLPRNSGEKPQHQSWNRRS